MNGDRVIAVFVFLQIYGAFVIAKDGREAIVEFWQWARQRMVQKCHTS